MEPTPLSYDEMLKTFSKKQMINELPASAIMAICEIYGLPSTARVRRDLHNLYKFTFRYRGLEYTLGKHTIYELYHEVLPELRESLAHLEAEVESSSILRWELTPEIQVVAEEQYISICTVDNIDTLLNLLEEFATEL